MHDSICSLMNMAVASLTRLRPSLIPARKNNVRRCCLTVRGLMLLARDFLVATAISQQLENFFVAWSDLDLVQVEHCVFILFSAPFADAPPKARHSPNNRSRHVWRKTNGCNRLAYPTTGSRPQDWKLFGKRGSKLTKQPTDSLAFLKIRRVPFFAWGNQ